MGKVYNMKDSGQLSTSSNNLSNDWSKCMLCQENKAEVLSCPVESIHGNQGTGYTTMADLLLGFSTFDCMPRSLTISRLDDGEGNETTLKHHKAKWHVSCRLKN